MLIKNYSKLVKPSLSAHPRGKMGLGALREKEISNLREKGLGILEKGLEAIQPEKIIKKNIRLKNNFLLLKFPSLREKIDIRKFKRIFLIGFGKGAANAALSLEKILANRVKKGIVLDIACPAAASNSKIECLKGSHPLPSKKNLENTRKIIKLLERADGDDLVLVFIFGGGSALLTAPVVDLSLLQRINKDLLKSGKDIYKINTVRKHLDRVKGGNLAKIAYPAETYAFICSDVPGNDISVIASGPLSRDKTTKKEAEKIARQFNWPKNIFQETPKSDKYFRNVKNIIFISNKTALGAMRREAEKRKIKRIRILSDRIQGEARIVGKKILEKCRKEEILLAGGETTVRVRGKGKGGRNQELVLGAIEKLKRGEVIISIDTDGRDNSEAAGAIGDIYTKLKAERLGLKIGDYLKNNDSFHFFKKTGDLIFSKVGTNVADLMMVLRLE